MLVELFLNFFKIGLFTFGGGYAMISLIEDICVTKKQWITHEEMVQITILAESTPGPVAVNCSTYVGYKQGKWMGAFLATLGMVLPSFGIIYVISMFLDGVMQNPYVAKAFAGIQVAVAILIVNAGISLWKKGKNTSLSKVLLTGAFVSMLVIQFCSLSFSSIALMLLAAGISLCATFVQQASKRQGGRKK